VSHADAARTGQGAAGTGAGQGSLGNFCPDHNSGTCKATWPFTRLPGAFHFEGTQLSTMPALGARAARYSLAPRRVSLICSVHPGSLLSAPLIAPQNARMAATGAMEAAATDLSTSSVATPLS
jgi:hypothetical protein